MPPIFPETSILAIGGSTKQQDEERVVAQATHDAGYKAFCFIDQVFRGPLLDVPTQMPGSQYVTMLGPHFGYFGGPNHVIPAANSVHVRGLRSLNMSELASETCRPKDQWTNVITVID